MTGAVCPRVFVEDVGGVIVASLVDSELLDQDVLEQVNDQLAELAGWLRGADVVLSFRDVRAMSSAFLAVVLRFARGVSRPGARLKLCGIAPNLREVFQITRFDRLFELHSDEVSALCAVEAERPAPRRGAS